MKSLKFILIFVALVIMYACKKEVKQDVKNNNTLSEYVQISNIENSNCSPDPSWFTMVNGSRRTPAPNEGQTSVFANNVTVSNCNFHQWSWQKFLWLTNEYNERPMFLDSLHQVSSIGEKYPKNKTIVLTDTSQASNKQDILKTPVFTSGKPVSSTIYYAIYMNDISYSTMIEYGPKVKADPLSAKNVAFPVGALELKTSWVDVNALSDASSYFVTDALINDIPTKVALLGMHVVGVVENHPEFVWATFEHDALAPYYDWSKATATTDAPVTSTIDYPLFDKSNTSSVKNITSPNSINTNVFSVYKYGTPIEIKSIDNKNVQSYMETSQNGSENFNNIQNINTSVKSQLSGIWNNYFYNGSLWINTEGYKGIEAQAKLIDSLSEKFALQNSKKGDFTRGSVAAYNITMETYVQVGFTSKGIHTTIDSNLVNCFLCHGATHKKSITPLNISHIFTGYVGGLKGLTKTQVKEQHVAFVQEQLVMLRKRNKE
ncbi:hypothetical protein Q4512_11245 [Oceanihabitans sp. 2_MG-2023]|uniref:hypothetical protein n=1 Tax=Oceanihabitans sp. 2_MG-2023 TaxID=3062661 RepID=UPI0026E360A7|nr:hypothetical protein [Oceanihabitans sp. 2_MG-2023]MDO6597492.1 hypothetical protein [Oceanihabitans sp. 2_MG-2023]